MDSRADRLPPQSHAMKAASLPRASSGAACRDGEQHYFTVKRASESNVLDNCRGTVLRRANSESPSATAACTPQRKSLPPMMSSSSSLLSGGRGGVGVGAESARASPSKKVHDVVRPASAISDMTAQKMESPKRVVIGDVITASRTSSPVSLTNEKPNGILKKDGGGGSGGGGGGGERALPALSRCVSMDAERSQQSGVGAGVFPPPSPPPPPTPPPPLEPPQKKSHLTVDTTLTASGGNTSRHTSSSESPEWPSPPEPLTPQTPTTPLGHMEFDSDTIKRLLRSLPSSPIDTKDDYDFGFHDDGSGQGRRGSQLSRTKSLNTHDRVTVKGANSVRGRQQHVVVGPVVCKVGEVNRSRMFNKVKIRLLVLLVCCFFVSLFVVDLCVVVYLLNFCSCSFFASLEK